MSKITVAFASVPKDGGTFTFYRNLREPLLSNGIDMRCVTVGNKEAQLWQDEFADDGCILLAPDEFNIKEQAMLFSDWCENHKIDIVMGVNSEAILSSLSHLPANIRIMSRCANAFDHGYRIALSAYDRISKIVALAPKQVDDLINRYGADPDRIILIPNGTSIERFAEAANQPRGEAEEIRLGFLGRIEHKQKGVLHLPRVLNRLRENGTPFNLKIAGKGVHEVALRRELGHYVESGDVQFVGSLAPGQIAEFFSKIDIYLFPSHFEGSPNALIEAIMAGCVPAAWRIEGLTDFIIEEGFSGILAKTGDCEVFADKISALEANREEVKRFSKNASSSARARFSLPRVIEDYAILFHQVMAERAVCSAVRPWSEFQVDEAFRTPYWRQLIPNSVKKAIKKLMFELRLANRYE